MATEMGAYRAPAKILHWLVAILVLAMLPVGQTMIQDGLARSTQNALFIFHKNVGVIVLLLMLVRLAYRVANPAPPLPESIPSGQRRIAHAVHVGLYVMIFVMAVSGYVRVRAGGFPIEWLDAMGAPSLVPRSDALADFAKATHFYARYVLVALIVAHVGAAAYHGLWKRDGVVARMGRARA